MRKLYQMVIFTVALCLPLAVSAQTIEAKIRSLEATVKQLQETLIQMRAEMAEAREASASKENGTVRTEGEDITLSTTGGGMKLKSDNGNSFQFGGRLMLDYDNYDFDKAGESFDASESEWRRTRINAKGTVKKDWSYGLTINIDDGDEAADINTAFIKYSGLGPVSFTIGKFNEPFGLERQTSSKWISTIERAMILDVINEGHGKPSLGGVMASGYHAELGNLNWALGVFDDDQQDADGDDNYAFTGRVAAAPGLGEDSFMHLAVAFSERERDESRYRVRTRYGVHTNNEVRSTLADLESGDDASQWGLEAVFVKGPFSLQAEYVDLEVDGGSIADDGGKRLLDGNELTQYRDLEGDGYYIQGAWTITGEQRGYKTKGAYFDKIKPKGAMGAWELVARYEEIDVEGYKSIEYGVPSETKDCMYTKIDDKDMITSCNVSYLNSEAEKFVLGLNWYANNNVKFMLNYIDAEGSGNTVDVDGDAISLRAQYAF